MKKIFFILIGLTIIFLIGAYLLNRDLYQRNPYKTPDTRATLEVVRWIQAPDYICTYQDYNQACVDVFVNAFQVEDVYKIEFDVLINNSGVGRLISHKALSLYLTRHGLCALIFLVYPQANILQSCNFAPIRNRTR